MRTRSRVVNAVFSVPFPFALISASFLMSCGGISGANVASPPPTYKLGGTVSGLKGSGLMLQDNGGNNLAVTGSGSFSFAGALLSGTPYSISVSAQPINPSQTCV